MLYKKLLLMVCSLCVAHGAGASEPLQEEKKTETAQKFLGFEKFELRIDEQGESVSISAAGLQLARLLVDLAEEEGGEEEGKLANKIVLLNLPRGINLTDLKNFVVLAENPHADFRTL